MIRKETLVRYREFPYSLHGMWKNVHAGNMLQRAISVQQRLLQRRRQLFDGELGDIAVGADALDVIFIGRARQRGVDHYRNALVTLVALDVAGERETVHFRHL